jgi:diaminohydroxyphosphoribosylaminopyrimidine deaminase/5-amino-6-(5-phosphoribosylamino)uracil reductase
MALALALAERGRGRTTPNPLVGAVVVDDEGVVVGRGAHLAAGEPHAEMHALADAGARARGATLYCTLEPCSHVGRTGPCAPRVADAGIRRAVIAGEDPNPLVAGQGIAYLRGHGLDVDVGVMNAEAEHLNRPFFSVMRRRRPFVTLKAAVSLDGCVAAAPGVRTPLTSPAANRHVHRLRAEVDAIAVGSGTVLADDPLLTARGVYRQRPLTRVVFDRRLRTPPAARLLSTLGAGPVIIISTEDAARAAPDRAAALADAGARLELLTTESGRPPEVRQAVETLAAMDINALLIEGGPTLHRAVWDAGVVDRVHLYVTPRILGAAGVRWLPDGVMPISLMDHRCAVPVGEDVFIEAYVHGSD